MSKQPKKYEHESYCNTSTLSTGYSTACPSLQRKPFRLFFFFAQSKAAVAPDTALIVHAADARTRNELSAEKKCVGRPR